MQFKSYKTDYFSHNFTPATKNIVEAFPKKNPYFLISNLLKIKPNKKSQSQQSSHFVLFHRNAPNNSEVGDSLTSKSCGVQEMKQPLHFCTESKSFLVLDPVKK